ncbi:hypothetical protein BME06_18290 [Klebsiella pneumoniae]|nr:hypothetical protein BME06_18290 [Klebsiella pneumoniae]
MKMPAFEWVHVQLHQQKGMISLSPPTICNSAHQIVRYGPHAVSTQFHPEFTAPIARSLIRHREAVLQAEGIDAQRLHDEVQESPQGAAILTRFVSAFLTPDAPGH